MSHLVVKGSILMQFFREIDLVVGKHKIQYTEIFKFRTVIIISILAEVMINCESSNEFITDQVPC